MNSIISKTPEMTIIGNVSNTLIRVIEYASRICYDATDKMTETSWEKYISARVKSHHESVIEHGVFSFVIDLTGGDYGYEAKSIYGITNGETMIHYVEETLANSNSLIHYVKESGWNPRAEGRSILILSGNMKMWREWPEKQNGLSGSCLNTLWKELWHFLQRRWRWPPILEFYSVLWL